ncbi:MAG: MATE family efflux transporter [Candidatus Heteroscillospira sp.]|jgi:putative MATE family efflux protein
MALTKHFAAENSSFFETESIWRILLRIAPPVMLAQLIQALYNIVDSYFVGQYSDAGLTALSVIFPIQLIVSALAIGTGVGVNTQMSREYARHRPDSADEAAGTGTVLAAGTWALFAAASLLILRPYSQMSANTAQTVECAVTYGGIVCVGSLGIFLESIWSKVHQAGGNMFLPMAAQIAGALVNIVLDPILIFGLFGVPELGITGAALATVAGQFTAAVIVGLRGFRKAPAPRAMLPQIRAIYKLGFPSIFMQMLFTVYIVALNVILAGFSEAAVTVLGLYYKLQSFFFIPLQGLETCIIPMLSYNFSCGAYGRCRQIMNSAMGISAALMLLGVVCFELIPEQMIGLFSKSADVLEIGRTAFRLVGLSFIPAVASLLTPVFFQAIGAAWQSLLLSLCRQLFCLIPIFWLLSLVGLSYTWLAFPISEIITGTLGMFLYLRLLRQWRSENPEQSI